MPEANKVEENTFLRCQSSGNWGKKENQKREARIALSDGDSRLYWHDAADHTACPPAPPASGQMSFDFSFSTGSGGLPGMDPVSPPRHYPQQK